MKQKAFLMTLLLCGCSKTTVISDKGCWPVLHEGQKVTGNGNVILSSAGSVLENKTCVDDSIGLRFAGSAQHDLKNVLHDVHLGSGDDLLHISADARFSGKILRSNNNLLLEVSTIDLESEWRRSTLSGLRADSK